MWPQRFRSGRQLIRKRSTHCRAQFAKWQRKVDEMGTRVEAFGHQRLVGRPEFKLRVGDYRVLYEVDLRQGRIYLHYVGHRREIYKRT